MENPPPSRPILLLGTRWLAEEVVDFAADIAGAEIVGLVENEQEERCGLTIAGLPVYWVDELSALSRDHVAICALGTTTRQRFTRQAEAAGMEFISLVHPLARIAPSATVGLGALVSPGALVSSHARIGDHAFLNRATSVGHHTVVGNHFSLMVGAHVAGLCQLGDQVYVGMGALITDRTTIGDGAIVGAGSLVLADVGERHLVMGVPARVAREMAGPK